MTNSLKITYVVCQTIFRLACLGGALFAPIYITPGYYVWSILLIFMMLAAGSRFNKLIDRWEQ